MGKQRFNGDHPWDDSGQLDSAKYGRTAARHRYHTPLDVSVPEADLGIGPEIRPSGKGVEDAAPGRSDAHRLYAADRSGSNPIEKFNSSGG